MKEGGAAGLLNEGGGAAGRGEQQASCLVAKQAVEFPQVYTSRVILRRCTNTYPPTTHTGQSFSSWIYMQGTGSSYRLHKGVDKGGLGGLQPPHFFETIVLAIVREY